MEEKGEGGRQVHTTMTNRIYTVQVGESERAPNSRTSSMTRSEEPGRVVSMTYIVGGKVSPNFTDRCNLIPLAVPLALQSFTDNSWIKSICWGPGTGGKTVRATHNVTGSKFMMAVVVGVGGWHCLALQVVIVVLGGSESDGRLFMYKTHRRTYSRWARASW